MQSWSQQQAGFLIQNIVLLAESKGIQSAILNGFSEEKVRTQFRIPERFQIAAVVCLGYKKEGYERRQSARFPFGKDWNGSLCHRFCNVRWLLEETIY